MPSTRYYHSCVGRCNRPESPARRTVHHTANAVIAPFAPTSTPCPYHLGNDLLLTGLARAPILLTVGGFGPLSLSANVPLQRFPAPPLVNY